MVRQLRGNIVAANFHLDQVHGQRKLIRIQETILIHVGKLPNLPQDGVGQLRFDHFCFGIGPGNFPVDWVEGGKDRVVFVPILVDDPVWFALTGVDAWGQRKWKGDLGWVRKLEQELENIQKNGKIEQVDQSKRDRISLCIHV